MGENLPLHWDYPVELQPGAKIQFRWIYAMSEPNLPVLHEYFQENQPEDSSSTLAGWWANRLCQEKRQQFSIL